MPIPSTPPVLPMPIADSGDVRSIPEQTPIGTNQLSFQSGFPPITSNPLTAGGIPPQREDFNAAYRLLSQHSVFQQSGGVYPWQGANGSFPGLNYLAGWHVMGTDGHEYIAILPSGPDVPDSGGGFVGPQDPTTDAGTFWVDFTEKMLFGDKYDIGQYHFFQDEMPRPGMVPLLGLWVENFSRYTKAVEYFESSWGQARLVTLDEYNARHVAVWHTNADDSKAGWEGEGGANCFVWDKVNDRMLVADLAGMTMEQSCAALGVGGVQGDAIPKALTGSFSSTTYNLGGAMAIQTPQTLRTTQTSGAVGTYDLIFNPARVVAVANKNQVRSWGALACVYLGQPAS